VPTQNGQIVRKTTGLCTLTASKEAQNIAHSQEVALIGTPEAVWQYDLTDVRITPDHS
jgi:hypothetical protein